MIIKEKENDINHFNSAKKYFNSKPSDYINSLKELNQISLLKKNISVSHMKFLCYLMLSKYEDIIEFYYVNRKLLDSLINNNNSTTANNEEQNEIKKIIALAFFNFNYKYKAKLICPDIRDEYDYKIRKFFFEFVNKEEEEKIETGRINTKRVFKNIKIELDKNMKIIQENKAKELKRISSDFVDDLFEETKNSYSRKNIYKLGNNDNNNLQENNQKESSKSKNDKDDKDNMNNGKKDNIILITSEEKKENFENIDENNIINKLINEDLINNNNSNSELEENNKITNSKSNINNNEKNEINIYSNSNNNLKNNDKEKNKKDLNINKDAQRKSCNAFAFVNPLEFTLSPKDNSLGGYSNSIDNLESVAENKLDNQNKNLVKVEIDDVQYFFIKIEKNNNIKDMIDDYDEYVNINFSGFRNKNPRKTTKLKTSKSLQINFDRHKSMEFFEKNEKEGKAINQGRQSKMKKTCFYKSNYILDNK